jgi:hypothetical protein
MERSKNSTGTMFFTLIVFIMFLISCQVSVKPNMGAKAEEPPEAPHHEGPIKIAGVWDSNIGLTYHIGQDGPHFDWKTVKNGNPTGQTGKGSMEGEAIFASWKGGPQGPGETKGRIARVNEHGEATRIEWENGVVFFRE